MNIWVKCMYVYGVWMCVRVFWSAQALHGETNALLEMHQKAKLHAPDTFKTSKYQNLPI